MKHKLKTGEKLEFEFAGKTYVFERINPFFLKVTSDGVERLISIEGTVEIRVDTEFYERPYFFKWKTPIQASSKTTLKFILKLPLQKKLVVEAGKRDIVIDSFLRSAKKAWYGPVSAGVLCDFVEPEVLFEPEEGEFANMLVRIVNPSNMSREITRFVVSPDRLMLFQAENGYFTNKIYVNIVREEEFSMDYGKGTTKDAKKAKKIIKEKVKSHKKVLTRFSPLNVVRDFGLGD